MKLAPSYPLRRRLVGLDTTAAPRCTVCGCEIPPGAVHLRDLVVEAGRVVRFDAKHVAGECRLVPLYHPYGGIL